ncbi:hypothetical protein [Chitinophaga sp. sic0106]|uniref:hypothetical protein n=1 Tax=Chitinophaga sp. sic0106 TaxID=2854785 RepID=UPI001C444444|nr:hypothetical protein [Chitinophaga sp. sic0106]MBV7533479.1 hypothetical protein [Chitinophaga sp. sic0106]
MKNNRIKDQHKAQTTTKTNRFQIAVAATPDIKDGYTHGLRALGAYSSKIKLPSHKKCDGSVDIDAHTEARHANSSRWDYCFGVNDEIYFVEVHPAYTGEVNTVIRKLQWLKTWLSTAAPQLNALRVKSRHPFYWIQSNGFHITKTSSQYRLAIQNKLKPVAVLDLTSDE